MTRADTLASADELRDAARAMKNDIKRYKARIVFAQLVSAGVMAFGIVAVLAYVDPALVAVPANQSQLYEGKTLWLLAGILFIGLGLAFLWVSHRRSTRSLWVVANTSPVDMFLTLGVEEDSDSTNYYALLRDGAAAKPRWRAWVDPTFRARALVGREIAARVFVDPRSGAPAAIRVEQGVLWANPLQRAEIEHDGKAGVGKST